MRHGRNRWRRRGGQECGDRHRPVRGTGDPHWCKPVAWPRSVRDGVADLDPSAPALPPCARHPHARRRLPRSVVAERGGATLVVGQFRMAKHRPPLTRRHSHTGRQHHRPTDSGGPLPGGRGHHLRNIVRDALDPAGSAGDRLLRMETDADWHRRVAGVAVHPRGPHPAPAPDPEALSSAEA